MGSHMDSLDDSSNSLNGVNVITSLPALSDKMKLRFLSVSTSNKLGNEIASKSPKDTLEALAQLLDKPDEDFDTIVAETLQSHDIDSTGFPLSSQGNTLVALRDRGPDFDAGKQRMNFRCVGSVTHKTTLGGIPYDVQKQDCCGVALCSGCGRLVPVPLQKMLKFRADLKKNVVPDVK
ncbi:hypothetical protein HDU98_004156, partial [Podochytrium sp. JEL0797]